MSEASGAQFSGQGLADPVSLEKIDQLFACNLGEYIDLPQLVVVGDQSSGKSSVLEGLTKLPFPRDSWLCTRFATHIIFRRTGAGTIRNITASIIPAQGSILEHAKKMNAWKATSLQSLDRASFSQTMVEVHEAMGLSKIEGGAKVSCTYSKDVFRLEICGPDEDHLSVTDIPGIFSNTTPGLTTMKDMEMVKRMVLDYMNNPRSIILAVVPANVDIATQGILQMARQCDPEGIRTLGIFTKPDLADKGTEGRILDLVKGRTRSLKLGWSVVRNPGQEQSSDPNFDRDASETEFFRDYTPWSYLQKEKVGAYALRMRLQAVQAEHIRREFPKVQAEANKLLKDRVNLLATYGPERSTADKQRAYLLDLSMKFHIVASQALTNSMFLEQDSNEEKDTPRLGGLVRERMEIFKKDMKSHGLRYEFEPYQPLSPGDNVHVLSRKEEDITDLCGTFDGIQQTQEKVAKPIRHKIIPWIERRYLILRGIEIDTFHPSLLSDTMRTQSSNWNQLGLGYVSDVITIVHRFLLLILRIICPDEQTALNLMDALADNLAASYAAAMEQARLILSIETNTLTTLNDDLDSTLYQHRSNVKFTASYVHDLLKAYYQVASKRFVDTICLQATGYCLLHGPRRPLGLFSPTLVAEFTEEQLEEIAGEDARVSMQRALLKKEIEDLRAAKAIMR